MRAVGNSARAITGLNAHIISFFHAVVEPLGVTSYTQLVESCKTKLNKSLSRTTMYVYINELSKVGYVDEGPDPDDKRKSIIQVIKRPEKALYSLISEFGTLFTLENFKAYLKRLLELCNENSKSLTLNSIPASQWGNDVEEVFNKYYVPSVPFENEKITVDENEKSVHIPTSENHPLNDETSDVKPQNSEVRQSNGYLHYQPTTCKFCHGWLETGFTYVDGQICCFPCSDKLKEGRKEAEVSQ